MKEINLEEILEKYRPRLYNYPEFKKDIKLAMKEACRQTLELAAENADLNYCDVEWELPEKYVYTGDPEYGYHYINKQSILNTIN
jgi:hypothetical protein